MKKILLLPVFLVLISCVTVGTTTTTCYQKAAIAEVSISKAYDRLLDAVTSGVLGHEKGKEAFEWLGLANSILDDATYMCYIEEVGAEDGILQALQALNEALLLIGGE